MSELCSDCEPVMSRQTAPGLKLLNPVSHTILEQALFYGNFKTSAYCFDRGICLEGRLACVSEKVATLTERLENIKTESQKAIFKNISTNSAFMEACRKDKVYLGPFFFPPEK